MMQEAFRLLGVKQDAAGSVGIVKRVIAHVYLTDHYLYSYRQST